MGKEKQELNEWARTRNLAYIIYLSNTTEKSPKSLKTFWHIPQIDDADDQEGKELISDEQFAEALKLYGINK